jgi:hypothetical protein
MKRSGENASADFAATVLRVEKEKVVEEFDFVRRTDAGVKIFEIRAAAEGDVLAIVDMVAIG